MTFLHFQPDFRLGWVGHSLIFIPALWDSLATVPSDFALSFSAANIACNTASCALNGKVIEKEKLEKKKNGQKSVCEAWRIRFGNSKGAADSLN